jgi:diadenosine tetraphosphate (Ap4A) HIT family hydrolase
MELSSTIHQAKAIIEQQYSPDGYNIGMNCGEVVALNKIL